MIKSLLDPDDKQPEEIKHSQEKTASDSAIDENFEAHFAGIESPAETEGAGDLLEISEPADDELIVSEKPEEKIPRNPPDEPIGKSLDLPEPQFGQTEYSSDEAENFKTIAEFSDEPASEELPAGFPLDEINLESPEAEPLERPHSGFAAEEVSNATAPPDSPVDTVSETVSGESPVEVKAKESRVGNSGTLFQTASEPESFAETARKSGLAYAAAITLFGSVVFMLIIGWFADLLLGSSPWGIVGGIVLGAAIGFFQFFRMTAQIFRDRN